MFNLDKSIAAWLRRFEHERAMLPQDVREVERHVRDHIDELVGAGVSLEEAFYAATRDFGEDDEVRTAYRNVYWGKVRRQRSLAHHAKSELEMLKNYVKTALRNLRRHPGYSFINIAGLAVGLACSFFILLWVSNELRYDRFHTEGDRIYRVMRHGYLDDHVYTWGSVPKPLADVLEANYPEIEHVLLMTSAERRLLTLEDRTLRREGMQVAPAFFETFTFPLLVGDPATVLDDPTAIVISADLAASLFGTDWRTQGDLVGRTLRVDQEKDFRITGVFENVPAHSSLQFDFVLPVAEFIARNDWVEDWGNSGLDLYVELQPGASRAAVNEKIKDLIRDNQGFADATPFLHPLTDLRLRSEFRNGQLVGGRITYVRIFLAVAVFVLLIACINFMNLATARSAQRAKEIGVRKVIGATQSSLVRQFVGESMLTAFAAFLLAALLVVALLPAFSRLTEETMALADLDLSLMGLMFGIAVLTGIVSGSYPALYLSSFSPIKALKGTFRHRPSGGTLRKGLVVFQFALSTLLIVGTFAIHAQVRYIQEKNLGMDRSHLVYTGLEEQIGSQYEAFRAALRASPGIEHVTTSSENPLSIGNNTTAPTWPGKAPDDGTLFYIVSAHYDFVETMKMELAAGRTFSRAFGADTLNYLINERAAEAMGLETPVGQPLSLWGRDGQIIGVVKDFHMNSLYQEIEPVVIRLAPEEADRLFVRLTPGETRAGLASLEAALARFNPGAPFEYAFLDAEYQETYRSEMVMGRLANAFAFLAIVISCLGLLGLSSFAAAQRTKEIGIRKVLGASVASLVALLSSSFLGLVALAFLVGAPLAYLAAERWLDGFAYRVTLGPGVFLLAGGIALGIALVTVAYQAVKAAVASPAESLRYE